MEQLIKNLICFYAVISATSAFVTLTFSKGTGEPLTTESIEENSTVTVRCEYPTESLQSRVVSFRTFDTESSANPTVQLNCPIVQGFNPEAVNPAGATMKIGAEINGVVCNSNSLSFDMMVTAKIPYLFQCSYNNYIDGEEFSVKKTLRSHITPTRPAITVPQETPKEGDKITFTCESEARPPPKLQFTLGSTTVSDADTNPNVTQTPRSTNISLDSDFGMTVLTWITTADKNMNGQTLKCDVYDHPSSTQMNSGQKTIAVYYGPESPPPSDMVWNLHEEEQKTIACSLLSNPQPTTYKWFNNTVGSPGAELPGITTDKLILRKQNYLYITKDSERVTETYTCEGINNKNNGTKGAMTCTVEILNEDITTTTSTTTVATSWIQLATGNQPGSGGSSGSQTGGNGSLTWEWALIGIGILAVVVIVIVGVCFFIKKRNSSSPAKIKKAAAKSPTPTNNSSPSYPYSSTGQPDIIRSNPVSQYNSSPAHQPNNRYSQPNVEDYADAIDHAPRSRKPIALDQMELDPYNAPPASEAGPPAYDTYNHDTYNDMETGGYGTGMRSPHDSYNFSYGAAC